jgi:D-cysteine desulfhydrase
MHAAATQVHQDYADNSQALALIPPGGSSVSGTIGFVDAGLELAAQIAAKELPEPDVIYLPFGTMGTACGLLIGLRAAGYPTRISAIRIVDAAFATPSKAEKLIQQVVAYMHSLSSEFPLLNLSVDDLQIRDDSIGEGYGIATAGAQQAVRLLAHSDNLPLETTYSAKACDALLSDMRAGLLKGKTALFYHTLNTHPLPEPDYSNSNLLPQSLHRYFIES